MGFCTISGNKWYLQKYLLFESSFSEPSLCAPFIGNIRRKKQKQQHVGPTQSLTYLAMFGLSVFVQIDVWSCTQTIWRPWWLWRWAWPTQGSSRRPVRLFTAGSDTTPDTDICSRTAALWMVPHCPAAEGPPSPPSPLLDGTIHIRSHESMSTCCIYKAYCTVCMRFVLWVLWDGSGVA